SQTLSPPPSSLAGAGVPSPPFRQAPAHILRAPMAPKFVATRAKACLSASSDLRSVVLEDVARVGSAGRRSLQCSKENDQLAAGRARAPSLMAAAIDSSAAKYLRQTRNGGGRAPPACRPRAARA